MEAARRIRNAVGEVSRLRQRLASTPGLGVALDEIKRFQSRRFSGTYADLLRQGGPFEAGARFFLEQLYSNKDYAARDSQFARIAGAIERFFPAQVASTAVALAELHSLTEELDQAMALAVLALQNESNLTRRYVLAWREVGRQQDRLRQLHGVLQVGREIIRLTRSSTLRFTLKMMSKPATVAGLGTLQKFLETGFDTFAEMVRGGHASIFLDLVAQREAALADQLYTGDLLGCENTLGLYLDNAQ